MFGEYHFLGVCPVACWLVPLYGCCDGSLLVANVRLVADGVWFLSSAGGSINASCAGAADFLELVLAVCNDASASDNVSNSSNTGDVMVSNQSRGSAFTMKSTGSINTTILGTASYPVCEEIGGGVLLFCW